MNHILLSTNNNIVNITTNNFVFVSCLICLRSTLLVVTTTSSQTLFREVYIFLPVDNTFYEGTQVL